MTAEARSLVDAFELHEPGQLVAIVGGGGKSSLMFALAETLPGRVILTTTTRIFAAQMKAAPAVLFAGPNQVPDAWPELDRALDEHGRCLVVGRVVDQKARGVSLDLPGRLLARPDFDDVVVDAGAGAGADGRGFDRRPDVKRAHGVGPCGVFVMHVRLGHDADAAAAARGGEHGRGIEVGGDGEEQCRGVVDDLPEE